MGVSGGWAHFGTKSHGSEPATTPDMSQQDVTGGQGQRLYTYFEKWTLPEICSTGNSQALFKLGRFW